MSKAPTKAFILAAGMGTRLRPYTDTMPKPMVPIAGKSIIKRTLEKLAAAGVTDVVINLHHLAAVLEDHLKDVKSPNIIYSYEEKLLESGGGIKKALHHFGNEPFYIINGDAVWDDTNTDLFQALANEWDSLKSDILLFVQSKEKMPLTDFVGDYHVNEYGSALRALDKSGDFMFAGVRIAHPDIFRESPDGAFSFLALMDKAQQRGRLHAITYDGSWYHISTPQDLHAVDEAFRQREAA